LRFVTGDRIGFIEQLNRDMGEFGRLRLASRRIVFVNTPEMAQELLIDRADDFQKSPGLRIVGKPLLGEGLLTAEGEDHLRQRRLVAPALAHHRVMRYAALMEQHTREHIANWRNGSIAMLPEMTRLTLGIVGEALFNANLLDEAAELGGAITDAIRHGTRLLGIVHVPANWKTPGNRRVARSIDRLNRTIYRLIEERRASREDKGDLLSMLLMSSEEDEQGLRTLTDQQVRDEAMTLFLAGHETTANAVTWSLYLLARHPEIQQRLQEEVDQLGGSQIAFADLPRLPLALQVFKEALRLYPPAFLIGRQARRETRIGGHAIEPGEIVLLAPYVLQRSPRYFEHPLKFDPHRFLPERESAIPRMAYLPFGAGRRICIGNQFALMEGQILLATLASRWHFHRASTKAPGYEALITLRPKDGMQLEIERRVH
jgi:cytochrome P450